MTPHIFGYINMANVPSWSRLLFLLLTALINFKRTEGAICEPIRIPMCQRLPYNLTRMPNLLEHSAQRNAQLVIEQYQPLVQTKCSDVLLFFLCSMFAPICPMSFRQEVKVIPPCRGVCEAARAGCEPVLRQYNLSWPISLNCEQLPMYNRGMCISPDSIVGPQPGLTEPHTEPNMPATKLPRCKSRKIRETRKLKDVFTGGKHSFAMTVVYNQAEIQADGTLILNVSPRLVFYHKKVPVQIPVARLWVPDGCLHRVLKPGKSYLLMGTENRRQRKLILQADSYIDAWRPKTLKRLKKWKNKMIRDKKKKRQAERRLKSGRSDSRTRHSKSRERKRQRQEIGHKES